MHNNLSGPTNLKQSVIEWLLLLVEFDIYIESYNNA